MTSEELQRRHDERSQTPRPARSRIGPARPKDCTVPPRHDRAGPGCAGTRRATRATAAAKYHPPSFQLVPIDRYVPVIGRLIKIRHQFGGKIDAAEFLATNLYLRLRASGKRLMLSSDNVCWQIDCRFLSVRDLRIGRLTAFESNHESNIFNSKFQGILIFKISKKDMQNYSLRIPYYNPQTH